MAKKTMYTKKLGDVVAKNAKSSSSGRYHVIQSSSSKKWGVVSEGSIKPVKAFEDKNQAVSFAISKATAVEVIVHGVDGRILNRVSFND
jgi:hypothetical protein